MNHVQIYYLITIAAWELKAEIRTSLILELKQAGIKTHLNYHSMEDSFLSAGEA